jgi:hypothetical protein
MSNFYDDSKFGVIKRKWFGLTRKHGGDLPGLITVSTSNDTYYSGGYEPGSATTVTHVARWYPKGPITVKKVGYFVMATMVGKATVKGRREFRFYTRGASASVCGKVLPATCGTVSAYTFNSMTTLTVAQCKAGEYMTITSGTPVTYKTTYALGTVTRGTVNGTLAFFVDYVPQYDASGKWTT